MRDSEREHQPKLAIAERRRQQRAGRKERAGMGKKRVGERERERERERESLLVHLPAVLPVLIAPPEHSVQSPLLPSLAVPPPPGAWSQGTAGPIRIQDLEPLLPSSPFLARALQLLFTPIPGRAVPKPSHPESPQPLPEA